MKSSWRKSSPVKAVARRLVASVAIHRVTGGCEAYTVSQQAVRIQPRNWPDGDADVLLLKEGSIQYNVMQVVLESPGSLVQGMLTKGFPVNPGELSTSPSNGKCVRPKPKSTWSLR